MSTSVVTDLGQQELAGDVDLCGAEREVAEEATPLLDEERLGQQLDLRLQNLDPLLQFVDEVVELR